MRGRSSISFRLTVQNPVEIVKHLVVGEAENGEALRRERGRARGVAGKLFVG